MANNRMRGPYLAFHRFVSSQQLKNHLRETHTFIDLQYCWMFWGCICKPYKKSRNRFPAWRAGSPVRQPYLSYRPVRLHRLAESIPRNWFLVTLNVYRYGLCISMWYMHIKKDVERSLQCYSVAVPDPVQHFWGVHIGARALHVLNFIWFGTISRLSHLGRRGVISSFKWFLSAFPRVEEGGRGSAPCDPSSTGSVHLDPDPGRQNWPKKNLKNVMLDADALLEGLEEESIEWFIENQPFSPSYDLAPSLLLLLFPVSKPDRRHTGRLRYRDNLLTGEGEWGRGGAKSYDSKKAWSSINPSILSGWRLLWSLKVLMET